MNNTRFLPILLCIITSIFLFLSYYLSEWFILIALIPFFISINNKQFIKSLFLGIFTGTLSGIIVFIWIYNYSIKVYFYSILHFIIIFLILSLVFYLIKDKKKLTIILPTTLGLFLIISNNFFMGSSLFHFTPALFSLLTLGKIFGETGIMMFIITINYLGFYSIYNKKPKIYFISLFFLFVILFISNINFSEDSDKIKLGIIQGNVAENWTWRLENPAELTNRYSNLIYNFEKNELDLIITPEYSLAYDPDEYPLLKEQIMNLSNTLNTSILIGMLDKHNNSYYDAVYLFEPNKNNYSLVLHANYPFPFESKVLKGSTENLIYIKNISIAVIICYEELISNYVEKLSLNNPDLFISLANNYIENNKSNLQHISKYSLIRSFESNKPLVRLANTGISYLHNPKSKEYTELKSGEIIIQEFEVSTNNKISLYYRFGKNLIYVFIIFGVIFFIHTILNKNK